MTATVGGLWDSLIAEGKPWWITANSDSHKVYQENTVVGGGDFDANGRYDDPVYGGGDFDFWPGYYSRTHVGSSNFSYTSVMAGLMGGPRRPDQRPRRPGARSPARCRTRTCSAPPEHQGRQVVRGEPRDRHGNVHVRPGPPRRRVLRPPARHRRQPHGPGYSVAAIDPTGPAMDVLGDADPWKDLWFYTNPIWFFPGK